MNLASGSVIYLANTFTDGVTRRGAPVLRFFNDDLQLAFSSDLSCVNGETVPEIYAITGNQVLP